MSTVATVKQKSLKQKIMDVAKQMGIDDMRFVKSPLLGDKNIAAFVIKRYEPSEGKTQAGQIAVSEYYLASHAIYGLTKALTLKLNTKMHIQSQMTDDVQFKREIVKTGGRIGLNTLYYHPLFGSYISMRCILMQTDILTDEIDVNDTTCQMCGACIHACPTDAITEQKWIRKKCLRNMVSKGFSKSGAKEVYQLLGCEKCQTCCPMNNTSFKEERVFDVRSILRSEQTRTLKTLTGSNMATRTRLITQTLAFAVGQKYKAALSEVSLLTGDESERISKMAVWAKEELGKIE